MKIVFLLVLDSLGIGSSKDSYKFNDEGSNTLGNIAKYCYNKRKKLNFFNKKLQIPLLTSLGLAKATKKSCGNFLKGFEKNQKIIGSYAYASEISTSKDTCSGHWEISGSPVFHKWKYFKNLKNSFPKNILKKISQKTGILNFLGNIHSSGTDILNLYGKQHIQTKYPILYTSSDSVFQVACHEHYFGLKELYSLCQEIRIILNQSKYNVCRVIARPFLGTDKNFFRTRNRKDYSLKPNSITIMEKFLKEKNGLVISIGKISDIFSGLGISKKILVYSIKDIFKSLKREVLSLKKKQKKNVFFFINFVDFDSMWGHRRDVNGYINELELFDKELLKFMTFLTQNDLLIITADHGCDPTWKGTDHTRENVPILLYNKFIKPRYLGHRKTFSDISQTIAKYFKMSKMDFGKKMILNFKKKIF
ncbi:Phosphopentomutase [Buchnera aphidicola (Periphyllus testudinaceus)]|uniref:phosphopentomutase n=1 Tax=Buchnera aphidicola TaxID=9 RepID=UPI003463E6E4